MRSNGYIGTYTKKSGKGIYYFELDEELGKVVEVSTGREVEASTYINTYDRFLYAVTRNGDECGIASYELKEDGSLEFINDCLVSEGNGCYVEVSSDGEFAFEACYGAGLARLYKINPQFGHIEGLMHEHKHNYEVGPKERQDMPHVHMLTETPDHQYVVALDLGTDKLVSYRFGMEGLSEHAVYDFEPGDGPRHVAFHDNGKIAYVVHELSNKVSVMEYDNGEFREIERHLTIPESFNEETKLAAVRLSHDQKFIYISNRGHDSIAIFEIKDEGRHIELVDIVKSGGNFPRDFNISPSDNYVVCAHQEENYVISVFQRDKQTGRLTLTDQSHSAPEGVCVQFNSQKKR
ncbi:lactonase family protein [Staphylococcus sp. SQ8-PEA]|uniref:Lactonase family protein n=1 Tax=Staphylococcus marylandisciuri TaxID=2981529 RepID=A0ABT2QQD5_9STAP|nr:lactonase family protein [Staphylococcus marylandisciuri]MCU5746186.1 lactonase family protein [Staphylococcus marylandisciuri]